MRAQDYINTSTTLDELCERCNDICFKHNLGRDEDGHEALINIDWTSLPEFGGDAPESTEGVWSWDEERLLVGEGWSWEIVDREES